MAVFLLVVGRVLPLYFLIGLGFLAGRVLRARKETVASLLIYVIAPFVIFHGAARTRLTPGILALPLFFFSLCSALSVAFLALASRIWSDARRNIVAFSAGTGNAGYFGLPLALALFDADAFGVVISSVLGFVLYENSVGFYITAMGRYSRRESLIRVLRLPTLYAYLSGILINVSGLPLGASYVSMAASFRGAYVVLGMMSIGLGIADMRRFELDYGFIGLTFAAKFFAWPLVAGSLVSLDSAFLNCYGHRTHQIIILLSIVPMAANMVAVATALRTEPEKSALAVLLSTVFTLLYLPVIAPLCLGA
jgi:predicted permease